MNALDYEAWRPALIAFCKAETPWMTQTLDNLRNGYPLTADNRRTAEALAAAFERAPVHAEQRRAA